MILHKINAFLKERERSRAWLARKIGISNNALNSICNGKSIPKLDKIYRIALALDVKPCELLLENNPFENESEEE